MIGLWREAPIRIFSAAAVKRFSKSLSAQELWDTWDYPQYLTGVLRAAKQALSEGVNQICAIEFGVASGRGLLQLQKVAATVEKETGVSISVYGFDSGAGLVASTGDFRDHIDRWQTGDYPMNVPLLKSKLTERTSLVLGTVAETVDQFIAAQKCAIGFVAFDLDYYSATVEAFKIFGRRRKMLAHVPCYFDDTLFFDASEYAGERLAIREFNELNTAVKIDRWEALRFGRPFSDRQWLSAMYVANDMDRVEELGAKKREAKVLESIS